MNMTHHATVRQGQRGISTSTIEATVTHGRLIRGRNAEVFFLGAREVREARARGLDLRRAQNTQVIVGHDGSVITCYRTSRPARDWTRRRARRSG